jgi:hypothetical protein
MADPANSELTAAYPLTSIGIDLGREFLGE